MNSVFTGDGKAVSKPIVAAVTRFASVEKRL